MSDYNLKEGELLGFTMQKNLEDFPNEMDHSSQTASQQSVGQHRPPLNKKSIKKDKSLSMEKPNLVIESKEHLKKNISKSRTLISKGSPIS